MQLREAIVIAAAKAWSQSRRPLEPGERALDHAMRVASQDKAAPEREASGVGDG